MKHTKAAVIALILGISASLAVASHAPAGLTVSYLGEWSGGTGGTITDDTIDGPIALALDGAGRVYIAEQHSNRVQVFTTDGRFVGRWGGPWTCGVTCQPGEGNGRFSTPSGLALDISGTYTSPTSGTVSLDGQGECRSSLRTGLSWAPLKALG